VGKLTIILGRNFLEIARGLPIASLQGRMLLNLFEDAGV
jgi:hypothetical protein